MADVLQALRLTEEDVAFVVANCEKQRFAYNEAGDKIRANQGHSVDVELDLPESFPPETLYHGTVDKWLQSIFEHGLQKMSRHHVHLSADVATATNVGSRRGNPVILAVDAKRMHADGHKFYVSANGVWMADQVPPCYLSIK